MCLLLWRRCCTASLCAYALPVYFSAPASSQAHTVKKGLGQDLRFYTGYLFPFQKFGFPTNLIKRLYTKYFREIFCWLTNGCVHCNLLLCTEAAYRTDLHETLKVLAQHAMHAPDVSHVDLCCSDCGRVEHGEGEKPCG